METKKTLISIIVPVYNTEKYIERCLDSIMKQDYPNFEVILVNDGSTDESGIIIQKYKEKYKNISYIKYFLHKARKQRCRSCKKCRYQGC